MKNNQSNYKELKCEGSCTVHVGDVRKYSVTHKPSGKDWGIICYCDTAVLEDAIRGLTTELIED